MHSIIRNKTQYNELFELIKNNCNENENENENNFQMINDLVIKCKTEIQKTGEWTGHRNIMFLNFLKNISIP